VNDKAGFARAFRSIIADPDLLATMREASRVKARDFDLDRIAERYEAVLTDAAASTHR
jgi:glycosyltransferase involved in cell wall biosynthesis